MYVDVAYIKKSNGELHKRTLMRESFREDGKVKHRTIANISKCSDQEVEAIKLALKHKGDLSEVGSLKGKVKSKQGLSVGAVITLKVLADRLGITKALGNSEAGKLVLWQVMARLIDQGSRLSAVRLAGMHAACDLLNLNSFNEDDLYENLDWLSKNQVKIEKRLFNKRYKGTEVPRLFLYDVTSSYLEGMENELGDWGYNRDGKKGKKQIVIGLLTDEQGVPVSVEVFNGNTKDTKTFLNQVKKLAERFKIKEVTMVGDRGMIKSMQIKDVKAENFNYITAITKPQIETLIKNKIIQIELFNEKLCEVESDDIRYILRRNPKRVEEIERTRNEKIEKVEELIRVQNKYLAEHKNAQLSVALRKIEGKIKKLKLSDFAAVEAEERILFFNIDEKKKAKKTILDGCYAIKTELKKDDVSTEIVHQRYKDLALVEQGFRTIKTGLLETRPIYVRKEKRTRGHVFVVMLAYIIVNELQKLWVSMDLTVEEGISELSMINSVEIKIKETSYQQIPQPGDTGETLLKLANIKLPEALPCRNIKVATRKKLPERRKKLLNQGVRG
ncbi:MAG: IS1634 family transposase [Mesoflavibacter sp.]|nr:IS1634 family transposase [Mesoflavibacter sp.]